jgi:hypothetical protein
MLAQLTRAPCDRRVVGRSELAQRSRLTSGDEACQRGEADEVGVARQVLDRFRKRPLIQRVDKVERRMTSAQVEWMGDCGHLRLALDRFSP